MSKRGVRRNVAPLCAPMFAPIRPLPGTTELNAAACADPYNIILHTGFPKIRRPFSTSSKNEFVNPIFRSSTYFRISEFFQLRKIECLFGEALCKMKLSVFSIFRFSSLQYLKTKNFGRIRVLKNPMIEQKK